MSDFNYIIGFDFGHGETSVAMVDVKKVSLQDGTIPAEDVYICQHSREPKITSLVGYASDGTTDVDIDIYDFKGFKSIEAYFKGPLVGSDKFKAISDVQKEHFRDFISTVYHKMMENPKNLTLVGSNVKYYAACPSGWSKEQRESYHNFLKVECGVPIEAVIEESRAAHVAARKKLYERNKDLSEQAKRIVVLDLGSSTLDITLHADKTYTDGFETGASMIEDRLLNSFLSSDSEFTDCYNKYLSINKMGKDEILLFLRYAKEDYFNKQKKYPAREITFSCNIDWNDLSSDEVIGNSRLRMKGSDFISLLKQSNNPDEEGYESLLKNGINSFIANHGKADAVILTGGASQMKFYKDIVIKCFDIEDSACIVDDIPSYSISQGVAMIGYMDSKCPIFDNNIELPPNIKDLSDNLNHLFADEVLSHYKQSYTDILSNLVDEWKNKSGQKTLGELFLSLDRLIKDWDSRSVQISEDINVSVANTVRDRINSALQETIRLYFGFDAPIEKFDIDYSFSFSTSKEDNRKLFNNILKIMENAVNNKSYFSKWNGRSSLEKDRSDDPTFVETVSKKINNFASSWFGGYKLDDAFDEEAKDCQLRLIDFYKSAIRKITCQV
jgi:hypothetical protein